MKCRVHVVILRQGCIQKLRNKILVEHVYVQTNVAVDSHNTGTYAVDCHNTGTSAVDCHNTGISAVDCHNTGTSAQE
jgi:hypothetical protein